MPKKLKRTVQPLPRYVRRRPSRKGWAFYFELPQWAREDVECPLKNEALGLDYVAAVRRAESTLLPAFDAWRSGDEAREDDGTIVEGTLDWMFAEYKKDDRYKVLSPKQRRNHERGFDMVGKYVLRDGTRLGRHHLSAVTTAIVDPLYQKLLKIDADGNTIADGGERRTTVNHAMKSCRRAWNICYRLHPALVPLANPFAAMGLKSTDTETPTATYAELQAFRATAKEMGLGSLATAALIGWEWLQREIDVFGTFHVQHYRSKEHPDMVRVIHEKTGEQNWVPLFDPEDGHALYPELMAELDAIKRDRIGGLMLVRDWGAKGPWPTWPNPNEPDLIDLTHVSRKVKQVIRKAGLRDELSFRSFRHGGFTEAGNAELTDREIMAQGRHKSPKVMGKYVKRTAKQVAGGARKRRGERNKGEKPV